MNETKENKMNETKEVESRNYDESAGFFYDDTVEAFAWDNDLARGEGYWVADKTLTIGDSTGQNPEESHQTVISVDVKLIVKDNFSLTMRLDDSFKIDASVRLEAIGNTVNDITTIVSDALGENMEGIATDAGTLAQNIFEDASKVLENNKGIEVVMISVCKGACLTVYGQENGTGKLDIEATSKGSGSNEGGAAIGGDNKSFNGNITINGAQVIASSKFQPAAIGGGKQASADNIMINGGYIDATPFENGKVAAIGSGDDKVATNITIKGGYVYRVVKSDKSNTIGVGDKSDENTGTGLFFNGVYLNTGNGNLGYRDGSIDYFTNGNYKGHITSGGWLDAYSNPRTEITSDSKFGGDKTSAPGYYAGTVNGGFNQVKSGYYFANSETSSIKGLNNNGFDIKGGAIFNEGGYLAPNSVPNSNNKSVSNGSAYKAGSVLGGAIYANGGTSGYPVESFSRFENNVTTGATGNFRGGAIVSEQDILPVTSSVFNSNKTMSKGGAIWANGTNVVIDDPEFGSNYASRGGTIYAEGIQTIANGKFPENLAGIDGGAVFVGGDKEQAKGATVQIAGTDFTDNPAKYGGAIYVAAYRNATISSADFINNEAGINGVGSVIYVKDYGTLTLNDVDFSGNRSTIEDADENVITDYRPIYNDGEINFTDRGTVAPYWLDKMVNRDRNIWDLTEGQSSGYFSDMRPFIKELSETDPGDFEITVNADDNGGISRDVLGRNANFAAMLESLTKIVLRGVNGQEDQVLYLNGDAVEYNGKIYTLTSSDSAEDYYEIVLTVTDKDGTPVRDEHIVVNKKNYTQGTPISSDNFDGFDFGESEGGSVLLEKGGIFEVHDTTFKNADGQVFTVRDADGNVIVVTNTVYLNEGQIINRGSFKAEKLDVTGINNAILGNTVLIKTAILFEDAELTVDKAQYDKMIDYTQIQSSGKMFVSSIGTGMTQADIDKLIRKSGISHVTFEDNLTDIHNLNFTADKSMAVYCGDGTGTKDNDTINFAQNSNVVFGSRDKTIDLLAGNNRIQLGTGSNVKLLAGLTNVSGIKAASSVTASFADVEFTNGRNAALNIGEKADFAAGNITGSDKMNMIKANNNGIVTLQNIALQNENDRIIIGANSKFEAGTIEFGDGIDRLYTGQNSIFEADNVNGAETISLGAYSTTTITGSISGTNKLIVISSEKDKAATLKASAVTGTATNDSFCFGNWNDVDFASLDFGDGNDVMRIGSYASVEIDSLDFGEGSKDKLTIGIGATLSVNTFDVDSLDMLSMSNDAMLYLGSDSYDAAMETEWGKKYSNQISKLA